MNTMYCIITNTARCINCKSCQIQCKVWHNEPNAISRGQHIHIGPYMENGKAVLRSHFLTCLHCDDPWCVRACPTGAMFKNDEGIVQVDSRACVGCKGCIIACPWHIPRWQASTGKVVKCDFCYERLQQGLEPACVTGCTAKALTLTKTPESRQKIRDLWDSALRPWKKG